MNRSIVSAIALCRESRFKPRNRKRGAFFVVGCTLEKLKISQLVRSLRQRFGVVFGNADLPQSRRREARNWEDVVDVEVITEVNKRKEQRHEPEQPFVAVLH